MLWHLLFFSLVRWECLCQLLVFSSQSANSVFLTVIKSHTVAFISFCLRLLEAQFCVNSMNWSLSFWRAVRNEVFFSAFVCCLVLQTLFIWLWKCFLKYQKRRGRVEHCVIILHNWISLCLCCFHNMLCFTLDQGWKAVCFRWHHSPVYLSLCLHGCWHLFV